MHPEWAFDYHTYHIILFKISSLETDKNIQTCEYDKGKDASYNGQK